MLRCDVFGVFSLFSMGVFVEYYWEEYYVVKEADVCEALGLDLSRENLRKPMFNVPRLKFINHTLHVIRMNIVWVKKYEVRGVRTKIYVNYVSNPEIFGIRGQIDFFACSMDSSIKSTPMGVSLCLLLVKCGAYHKVLKSSGLSEICGIMTEIEKLYEVIPWPMRPDDPKARVRFANLVELFNFLLANHPFFEYLRGKEHIRVLDVMAGSGIAGAALSKALTLRKLRVNLTVNDVRQSDLQLVQEWLEEVEGVEVETVATNVSGIHEVMSDRAKYYDVALLWGLSTPHLDPWEMARAYSSICHLLRDDGIMAMDEVDRIFSIFYKGGYKDFLTEGEAGGAIIASAHVGYDERRGTFKRATYTLPGFKEVAKLNYRFWDLAGMSAMGWLFFKDVDLIPPNTHRIQGLQYIILLKEPRRIISPEMLKEDPKLLHGQ